MRVAAVVLVLCAVAMAEDKKSDESKTGRIIGELKSKKDTDDKKNTIVEVLAPGEEKPRKYFVNWDPAIKAPIPSVLKAVRAAKVGDQVEFEWVQTNHGPAITSFKVFKKSDGKAGRE